MNISKSHHFHHRCHCSRIHVYIFHTKVGQLIFVEKGDGQVKEYLKTKEHYTIARPECKRYEWSKQLTMYI